MQLGLRQSKKLRAKMATPLSNYLRKIPANDLDQPIDYKNKTATGRCIPRDLGRIADGMPSYEGAVAMALELDDATVARIGDKKAELRTREALTIWKARRGGAKSTPRELITAFYKEDLYDYCDIVCHALGTTKPGVETIPGPADLETNLKTEGSSAETIPGPADLETNPKTEGSRSSARAPSKVNVVPDSGEIDADSSDSEKNSFSWCSFTGQQNDSAQSSASASNQAYPAVFPCGVNLWKEPQVTVAITKKSIGLLEDWGQEEEDILEVANRWHKQQEHIPEFVPRPVKGADIIVELNVNGRNESLLGNAGKAGSTKPTMWLDLSGKDKDYNEYLVVHEFGHALGLGHEHQRSDFRDCVIPFLDEKKMRKKLGDRYKDWERDDELDINSATEYDPKSVMHYWFEKQWLKYGYDDKKKIHALSDAKILSEKMTKALLGVHDCLPLPTQPSTEDLEFLNREYGKIKPKQ